MMPGSDVCDEDFYGTNPYDSFMKKHLQHYGYYTGRNQNYKHHFKDYEEWEKNYGYNLSSASSDGTDSDTDEDKTCESKLNDDPLKTTQLIYSCGDSGKMVPRLREPRSLYALNKELGPQQAARWPSDLQVINEKIQHLQTIPAEPEPFYKHTGFEKCPMTRGEATGGKVVYSYETNSPFFMKSRAGGSRNGCDPCSVSLDSDDDTTLLFESRFESGNLGKAVQVGDREYELWLRYDLYTNKHTQWFYFRVSNTRADVEYRFTIVNFTKPDSLYNDGMKPVVYSEKEAELNKVGWIRAGNDIKYYKNNLRYEMGKGDRNYYSMTWTMKFKHDHDTVYFSHCYPYTYTDLQNYLLELSNDPIKSRICKQRVLCRTLAGNLVYVLTITSASQNPEDMKHKRAVVVTSRVHPGESNSSWMMKGFLDFVTSNSPDAKLLRDTFIFKVVPMLNPDGVIVGNYRCSLTGRDLNRNYKTTLKDAYPSVWHTKMMIRKLLLERDVVVYCDLHGHSRKQNVFIYGCEQHHKSNKRFQERIFPSMLNRNTPEKFCFKSCKFKVQKSKEGTGRVVMWNMGIMNSYTMEATFCGSSLGKKKGLHFNQRDFEMMGYHFCDTLLDYCDPDLTKYKQILNDLVDQHEKMVLEKLTQKGLNPDYISDSSDLSTDTETSDGGSDSSVSDGPPLHLQFTTKPKKKKLKSKRDREKLLKEEARKMTPVEDKKLRHNQVKPLKQETGKQLKYVSNAPKRARSLDERTSLGIPVFVQERFEEKQQKKHDYLEALTAAYISNNIPIVTDPAFVKLDSNYMKGEMDPGASSTCKETESKNDKCNVTYNKESAKMETLLTRQPTKVAMVTSDIWSSDQVVHFRYSGKNSEHPNSPHLAEPGQHIAASGPTASQSIGEALTDSTRFQSVFRELDLHRITPKWLQEEASRIYARKGDSPFKISRIFGRREVLTSETSIEDSLNSNLVSSATGSLASRKHKPHLLEVSAAQQRQTETLTRDKCSPIKTHPNPFDEIADSSKGAQTDEASQMSSNVQSSSIVQSPATITTVKIVQVQASATTQNEVNSEQARKKSGHNGREKSGRKSRKSMREDDGVERLVSADYASHRSEERQESAESRTPRSADSLREQSAESFRQGSAESRRQRITNVQAMDIKATTTETSSPTVNIKAARNSNHRSTEPTSVQDIAKALPSSSSSVSIMCEGASSAGEYIKKLIKDTSEEIKDLTNEIQQDLEKKNLHKLKDTVRDYQLKDSQLKDNQLKDSQLKDSQLKDNQIIKENTKLSGRRQTGNPHFSYSTVENDLTSFSSSSISEGRKMSSDKNLFPSVLPSAQMVTDSFNPIKSEESTRLSPIDSSRGEAKLNLQSNRTKEMQEGLSRSRTKEMQEGLSRSKTKEMQEGLSRSRSLKRHASINSVQSSRSLAQSMSQLSTSSSSLDHLGQPVIGTVQTKLPKPVPDESEGGITLRRQLGASVTSYSPIAKGVRLNKHNLVFKADGQSPDTSKSLGQYPDTSRSLGHHIDMKDTSEGEHAQITEQTRSKSARSRQVVETIPTKISLIICQDHHDVIATPASHLLSLSRQGQRSIFSRPHIRKK